MSLQDAIEEELEDKIDKLQAELDSVNHDYDELMKERADYVAENERLRRKIDEAVLVLPTYPGRAKLLLVEALAGERP